MENKGNKDRLAYSVGEVAEVLGIGRNVAYELIHRPDFPAVRISRRRVVVSIDGLRKWLERQAEHQTTDQTHPQR